MDSAGDDQRAAHRAHRQGQCYGWCPGQDRDLGQPTQRPHGWPQPAQRDREHRPHHLGVELFAGASRQFFAGVAQAHRPLVGAQAGHHVEGVGDGDDAGCE